LNELNVAGKSYASEIIRAKTLFREHGCIGCHQIGGEGGPISVDLREETSGKPLSRIDFSHSGLSHDEHTLANWIKIHFTKDPATFVPGDPDAEFNTEPIAPSGMPPFQLSEKDADALTAYILGLNRKGIPPHFLTLRPPEPKPTFDNQIARGRHVYEEFGCAACHGADGRGGIRNFNAQNDVTPNLRRAVSTYTREELKEKISEGVAFLAKHNPVLMVLSPRCTCRPGKTRSRARTSRAWFPIFSARKNKKAPGVPGFLAPNLMRELWQKINLT
jgi:hypothetical protein